MSTAPLPIPIATDEAQILAVVETLSRAHLIKDSQLFAAQFAPDAAIFNLAPPLIQHGVNVQEKRRWLEGWETPVRIEPTDVSITVCGDLAYCHCYLQMSGMEKGTQEKVRLSMRETLCLERKDGAWRIAHEHTSMPFCPLSPERVNKSSDSEYLPMTSKRDSTLIELMPDLRPATRDRISKIAIKSNGIIIFIDPHDLVVVEAQGNYVLLKQDSGGSYLLRESISKTEEKLKACGFVRIHRSVLVNPAFVKQIRPMARTGEYELLLKNGRRFTVTRTFKKNLATLARLWIGTGDFVVDR